MSESDCHSIESEIQAKGKTAPRITPDDIEANIASVFYFTAAQGAEKAARDNGSYAAGSPAEGQALGLLTFCVMVLKNGFIVHGVSACASPENFDAEIGRNVARANAVQEIWRLMDYELRSKLHHQAEYEAKWHAIKNSGGIAGAVGAAAGPGWGELLAKVEGGQP